jgi:hypothetical protein
LTLSTAGSASYILISRHERRFPLPSFSMPSTIRYNCGFIFSFMKKPSI